MGRVHFDFGESSTGEVYANLLGLGSLEDGQSEETTVLQYALYRLGHFVRCFCVPFSVSLISYIMATVGHD